MILQFRFRLRKETFVDPRRRVALTYLSPPLNWRIMRVGHYIDLTGQVFGKIKVISASDEKRYGSTQKFWNCICECGKELLLSGQTLRRVSTRCCRDCYTPVSRVVGCGVNIAFSGYRCGAVKRGLTFELTPEQFKELTQRNCHYCGSEPSNVWKAWSETYVGGGIDRKDNTVGYIFENCLPCCKICNRAKRESSYNDFIVWLKKAGEHAANL